MAISVTEKPTPEPGGATEGEKVSREAGIYVYSRVAASLLALVGYALAARLYPKAGFAYLAYVLLIYETAVALGSLGLADAVFYFIGKSPSHAGAIVRQTSLLLVAMAVPVIGAIALVILAMSPAEIDLRPALPWLALVVLVELPTQPAVNQLIASGHAQLASALFVGFALLRAAAVLTPAFLGMPTTAVPMVMALTGMARLVAHLIVVRRFFPDGGQGWLNGRRLWSILAFAVPAGVAVICGKLNAQLDKYVVGWLLGPPEMADYAIASWELPLITLLPYAIGAVLQSRFVRLRLGGHKRELLELWHNTVRKTALLVVPLTMLVLFMAGELIEAIFGAGFARATLPFQIYTLIILHRVASYGAMLQAMGDTGSLFLASLILIGGNLVLSVPFTLLFGFPGAALATLLANVPAWIYTLRRIARALGVPMARVLPWRAYAGTLLLSAAVGAATLLVAHSVGIPAGARLAVAVPVFVGLWLVAGRALGLVHADDLTFLREWLQLKLLKRPGR